MTKQQATTITQNTLLPIGLIATLIFLAFQIGGSYSNVQANTSDIQDVLKTVKSMESRLIKMETTLEVLAK